MQIANRDRKQFFNRKVKRSDSFSEINPGAKTERSSRIIAECLGVAIFEQIDDRWIIVTNDPVEFRELSARAFHDEAACRIM